MLDQEKLTNQDMESLGEELLKEKQSQERELHALRAEKDRQVGIRGSPTTMPTCRRPPAD